MKARLLILSVVVTSVAALGGCGGGGSSTAGTTKTSTESAAKSIPPLAEMPLRSSIVGTPIIGNETKEVEHLTALQEGAVTEETGEQWEVQCNGFGAEAEVQRYICLGRPEGAVEPFGRVYYGINQRTGKVLVLNETGATVAEVGGHEAGEGEEERLAPELQKAAEEGEGIAEGLTFKVENIRTSEDGEWAAAVLNSEVGPATAIFSSETGTGGWELDAVGSDEVGCGLGISLQVRHELEIACP
jgi:hypothetical protein